jgi:hypothetical protein
VIWWGGDMAKSDMVTLQTNNPTIVAILDYRTIYRDLEKI